MGSRERRKKNMVAPEWGSFQNPEQVNFRENNYQQEESQEQEFKEELPGEMRDEQEPEGEKPEWGDFQSPETYQGEPDPSEDEGILKFIGRNAFSNAARVVERIGGGVGDTEKFLKDVVANVPSKGGFLAEAISEYIGKDRWERMVRGMPGKEEIFPTSEHFKKGTETLTGNYTKPRSKNEASFQELSGDIGSAIGGGASSYRNAILIPSAANAVKDIVEKLGFGEDLATKAKMAVWLPLSLANNVNGSRYASEQMNMGRQGIPATAQSRTPRLLQRLDDLERSPMMLSSDPRSDLARQQIHRVRTDIANGQTSVRSLMTAYDGVNATKRSRGLFDLGRTDRKFATNRINEVNRVLRDEIRESSKQFPEAFNSWEKGLTSWAVIHQSNAITNWVESIAKGPYAKLLTGPTAALFGIGAYGAKLKPAYAGGASATSAAGYKTGQVLYRMYQDPNLRRYYWNAIRASQMENLPVFIHNYQKLKKEVENSPVNKKEKAKKNDHVK